VETTNGFVPGGRRTRACDSRTGRERLIAMAAIGHVGVVGAGLAGLAAALAAAAAGLRV
jgi:NADPH-dependent 2,4-dienoyl-CoA reductase/sulfur reductase-like enzyme